jgi:DNA-binding response OmpR family regulator
MENAASQERVLIVEDEPLVNLDIAEALRDDGFEVLQAYTGEEALEILSSERGIRVVFTDVNLPGAIDGIAVAGEVGRRWPQVEVLVTSGHYRPGLDRLDAISHYGRFVPKPYPVRAVARRIHEIIAAQATSH